MSDLDTLRRALPQVGAKPEILDDSRIAHVVASGHRVLSRRAIPGVRVELAETSDAISGTMVIEEGVELEHPVHLCFGLPFETGVQRINMALTLKPHARASILAHCLFPFAERAQHLMDASITLEEKSTLTYLEGHFHGPTGGMYVRPKALVTVGPGSRYFSDFSLIRGRVGTLMIDYEVEVAGDAIAELTAKVFGHGTDEVQIKETARLLGHNARGLIKTRVVLEDDARAEITGVTEAHAQGARGHVDCKEIIKDRATASAVPIVKVFHPQAKVTHEAAIGSVDKKELETLMARGLCPEEAVEMIVSGILR